MFVVRRGDEGQVVPLVALVLVLVGAGCLLIAQLGGAAALRARAVAVADASALAGATAGERTAREVATANGARAESVERVGARDVRVRVALGRARASARARPGDDPLACVAAPRGSPPAVGCPGGADVGRLAPALRAALAGAGRLLGRPVPVTSGYRSRAEQARLYARRASRPYPVAAPGRSQHERGLAVDVPASFVPTLLTVAARVGLCRPYPVSDPVHFELCRRPPPVPGPATGAG